jgi:hypothetical protein
LLGINVDGVIIYQFLACSVGVYGLILPLHEESYCIALAQSSVDHGILLIYQIVLTVSSDGVPAHASLPDILDIVAHATSTFVISSFFIYHLDKSSHIIFLTGFACIVHPKAFLFMGEASAFHAQNTKTLFGV